MIARPASRHSSNTGDSACSAYPLGLPHPVSSLSKQEISHDKMHHYRQGNRLLSTIRRFVLGYQIRNRACIWRQRRDRLWQSLCASTPNQSGFSHLVSSHSRRSQCHGWRQRCFLWNACRTQRTSSVGKAPSSPDFTWIGRECQGSSAGSRLDWPLSGLSRFCPITPGKQPAMHPPNARCVIGKPCRHHRRDRRDNRKPRYISQQQNIGSFLTRPTLAFWPSARKEGPQYSPARESPTRFATMPAGEHAVKSTPNFKR